VDRGAKCKEVAPVATSTEDDDQHFAALACARPRAAARRDDLAARIETFRVKAADGVSLETAS
jgi:hypothetical protein